MLGSRGFEEREKVGLNVSTVVLVDFVGLIVPYDDQDVEAALLGHLDGFAEKGPLPLALNVYPLLLIFDGLRLASLLFCFSWHGVLFY